jgi:hypothetical protein
MQLETPEQKADAIIKGMMSSGVAGAIIPLPLGIPFMGVVAAGVVGGLFISAVLNFSGAGYPVAVALDAAQATAIAYAVGTSAKVYFSGEHSRKELGAVMRNAFKEAKQFETAA